MSKENSYYDVGGIEVIDYIKAKMSRDEYKGFLKGNVLKYISRSGYKDDAVKDLKKAYEYLGWLIEEESKISPKGK